MATSTNYGWAEPDNASLVKNGASDMRTLGNAIDASLWNSGFGQAGKNRFINADMAINQRNFSSSVVSTSTPVYGIDRWKCSTDAGSGTVTYSVQQFTTGTAPASPYESKQFARVVTTGQTLAGTYAIFSQSIENVRNFAGRTVTISFWAKAASGTPKIAVEIEQSGVGSNPRTYLNQVTISTSWARYSITASIPAISGTVNSDNGQLAVNFWVSAGATYNSNTGSIGIQSNTFDFWGCQIETGSIATPFQTASGSSTQAELAMCQRYLPAFRGEYSPLGGFFVSTTQGNWVYNFAVPARIAPTGITISSVSDFQLVNKAIAAVSPTSITWNYGGTSTASVSTTHTAGSPTSAQGEVGFLRASTSSAYILFTGCEL